MRDTGDQSPQARDLFHPPDGHEARGGTLRHRGTESTEDALGNGHRATESTEGACLLPTAYCLLPAACCLLPVTQAPAASVRRVTAPPPACRDRRGRRPRRRRE